MPIGGHKAARLPRWLPSRLGTSARFILRPAASLLTLAGSNVTAIANDGGTAGSMSAGATPCTLDASVPLNGYSAVRTSSTSSSLKVATGGPSGTSAFHLVALAQTISQPGGGQNNSTFMLAGPPGNDGSHMNSGIGCTAASNGAWTLVGGFGNPIAQGPSISRAVYDARLHVFEAINDGTQIIMNRDGGRIGAFTGATTLSTGEMGLQGWYPLSVYGPPDTRVYWAGWFDRALTATERGSLLRYLVGEYAITPFRYIDVLGDSRTAGHISGANTTSYVEQMVAQYAALGTPEYVYYKNDGVTSESTAQILARVTPTFFDYFAPRGFRRQYMIIRGRTNDPTAGLTPAQSYANLVAASVLAQAQGIKTIISTEHSTTTYNSSDRADVAAFNTLVLANNGGADGVADIRALIPNYATTNPTTTELPDGVHQSNAILAAEATIFRAAVDAIP